MVGNDWQNRLFPLTAGFSWNAQNPSWVPRCCWRCTIAGFGVDTRWSQMVKKHVPVCTHSAESPLSVSGRRGRRQQLRCVRPPFCLDVFSVGWCPKGCSPFGGKNLNVPCWAAPAGTISFKLILSELRGLYLQEKRLLKTPLTHPSF